jgi:hypothetical protein
MNECTTTCLRCGMCSCDYYSAPMLFNVSHSALKPFRRCPIPSRLLCACLTFTGHTRLSSLALVVRLKMPIIAIRRCAPVCALCPVFTILILAVTNSPPNFIGSSTIASPRHVPNASHNRSFLLGFTLPSCLPSCAKIIPKADEERPSHASARFPLTIVRVNYCHTCYTS